MPKRGRKRNLSPSQASGIKPKRLRKAPASPARDSDPIVIDSDHESDESDDLKAILAQIKAQEESERLGLPNNLDQPSIPAKDTESTHEDDEAMARRLATEWAQEAESTNIQKGVDELPMDLSDIEQVHPNGASASTSSISKGKGSLTKTRTGFMDSPDPQGNNGFISVPIRPDEGLMSFRDMFTKTRPCSKCGKDVQSSRGCVSDIIRLPIYVSLTQSFRDATGYIFFIAFAANITAFASCSL